ncbi:hypothetical protein QV01_09545 [Gallibacterium genomosp. 3]|uniref:Alpha/beta hydrolase n=1 Tax=Gallibacterium genomosp. 3 TaxID=505345 RepID=A0A1A7NMM8_9PAST|nr:hypothetical protein [Gallibacterium genomosp. 3]OBW90786.1 hypothetical protein QV01_09545 [Gallibacterium genomosp. 3]
MKSFKFLFAIFLVGCPLFSAADQGKVTGTAFLHTQVSIDKGIENAEIALPASITNGKVFQGKLKDAPATQGKAPVVVFLHGSSGLNPKLGYDIWQKWLAENGIASFMFDSMQLENRVSYTSPIDKNIYEKIHQLRSSEIKISLDALAKQPWADISHLFLAGTSEGAVPVARYDGDAFIGKLIYSWSCEDNYFVKSHQTSLKSVPTINIMSSKDKYFSTANSYIGNEAAIGNCSQTFAKAEKPENFQVILIPNAPHTLINLPAARSATLGFIEGVLKSAK